MWGATSDTHQGKYGPRFGINSKIQNSKTVAGNFEDRDRIVGAGGP